MRKVYVIADNIYSPLGLDTAANMHALLQGRSGIQEQHNSLSPEPFCAALFGGQQAAVPGLTTFESIAFHSAQNAIAPIDINLQDVRTGFILSSTKGNIGLLESEGERLPDERFSLNGSAKKITTRLGLDAEPLVVSHACISGLLAMITGMRLIQAGRYDTLIVTGADLITSFIYSGFKSFQAISANPCKPFDAARDGISLGEAAATVVLSATARPGSMVLSGGSVSNDANHISGPSRTGEELWLAIRRAIQQAGISENEIDFISAHGTATRYNDEMEAKAITLASMENVPVNSLKGYYGHTLGAAGLLESIVTMQCMRENILLPTLGYTTPGTEKPIRVIETTEKKNIQKSLKTASGFGGCNAAIVLEKN